MLILERERERERGSPCWGQRHQDTEVEQLLCSPCHHQQLHHNVLFSNSLFIHKYQKLIESRD